MMTDGNLFGSMVDSIKLFENGRITVKVLLADLKNVYWNLSERPEDFSKLYFENWGLIEETYAIHLYHFSLISTHSPNRASRST